VIRVPLGDRLGAHPLSRMIAIRTGRRLSSAELRRAIDGHDHSLALRPTVARELPEVSTARGLGDRPRVAHPCPEGRRRSPSTRRPSRASADRHVVAVEGHRRVRQTRAEDVVAPTATGDFGRAGQLCAGRPPVSATAIVFSSRSRRPATLSAPRSYRLFERQLDLLALAACTWSSATGLKDRERSGASRARRRRAGRRSPAGSPIISTRSRA
jgi:hypothetical protein